MFRCKHVDSVAIASQQPLKPLILREKQCKPFDSLEICCQPQKLSIAVWCQIQPITSGVLAASHQSVASLINTSIFIA